MNALDSQIPYALDGHAGGTYAPSGAIVINGAGLTVGGTSFLVSSPFFTVTSATANFNGDVGVLGGLGVSGTLELSSAATFHDAVTVEGAFLADSGATFEVDCGALFAGAVSVLGATTMAALTAVTVSLPGSAVTMSATTLNTSSAVLSTFAGAVAMSNGLTVSAGGLTVSAGTVALQSAVTLTSTLTPSGAGHIRRRPAVGLPSADTTVSIADGDYFTIPAVGGTYNYKLTTVGASNGDVVRIRTVDTTFGCNVIDDTLTLIQQMKSNVGFVDCAEFMMIGGAWFVTDRSIVS